MPHVEFTPQLRRFLSAPAVDTPATTLRAALDDAFAAHPRLRGYVLDDQGVIRFVDLRGEELDAAIDQLLAEIESR